LETSPQVDESFFKEPSKLNGVAFYATSTPNIIIDISGSQEMKQAAIRKYSAQLSDVDMQMLLMYLRVKEQEYAANELFTHGEAFKVLRGFHLHRYPDAINTYVSNPR
jgi:hypothetical protein